MLKKSLLVVAMWALEWHRAGFGGLSGPRVGEAS